MNPQQLCTYLLALQAVYGFVSAFDSIPNGLLADTVGYYRQPPGITNLTTLVGKTINFNCTLNNDDEKNPVKNMASFAFKSKLHPTWLKADPIHSITGHINGFRTENIIVTRKGMIADIYRDKMKLISHGDQFQTLQINNVNVNNEGKYICREFNSQYDKLFYLNVFASVSGLNIQFDTQSKYFHSSFIDNTNEDEDGILKAKYSNQMSPGGSISIKENDILTVNCTVNVSKPAANVSILLIPNHRMVNDVNTKKLSLHSHMTYPNADMTLRTVAVAKFTVSRLDNHKSITCVAENSALDEKWESKRTVNVLYAPKCSKYQKLVYHTGINQSIELECRMTDANPPYLDFNWKFLNEQAHTDRTRSSGFTSRVNWTPKSLNDFGEIQCFATNGIADELDGGGECKMQLQLGGPPNPPFDCYHKENNKTIIIECKPGFEQGDPEVYFYLLKKKSNDVLVEYARKRDSCSFLISNLILEEHLNEFYVYSSNKYGNNRPHATKVVIENKEFLLKNTKKQQDVTDEKNKRLSLISGAVLLGIIFVSFLCYTLIKCQNNNSKNLYVNKNSVSRQASLRDNSLDFHEAYKYSSHQTHYQSKSGVHIDANYYQNKKNPNEKSAYNDTSSSEFDQDAYNCTYDRAKLYGKVNIRSPSLLNNIQDLDMSPKSKRMSIKEKAIIESGCSRSLTEEITETDRSDDFSEHRSITDDEHNKLNLYTPIKNQTIANTIKMNDNNNGIVYTITKQPSMRNNVWYGNQTDGYCGIDRAFYSCHGNTIEKLGRKTSDYNNYNDFMGDLKDEFDEDREEKKLFQWPTSSQTELFSTDTLRIENDNEKCIGILV